MNETLLIAGMALVTFAIRYPVLAFLGRLSLPDPLLRALGYVPPAVLAAIVMPAMLMPQGDRLDLSISNAYLVAGILAGAVAWRSRNLLLTIVLGMAVFLAWRWMM